MRPHPLIISAAALLFIIVAVVAPSFGWDPIGGGFGASFARFPGITTAGALLLVGVSFWSDWRRYKQTGDDSFQWRLALYGIVTVAILVAMLIYGI